MSSTLAYSFHPILWKRHRNATTPAPLRLVSINCPADPTSATLKTHSVGTPMVLDGSVSPDEIAARVEDTFRTKSTWIPAGFKVEADTRMVFDQFEANWFGHGFVLLKVFWDVEYYENGESQVLVDRIPQPIRSLNFAPLTSLTPLAPSHYEVAYNGRFRTAVEGDLVGLQAMTPTVGWEALADALGAIEAGRENEPADAN